MATVGRDPETTRNELSAAATGTQALQKQGEAGLQQSEGIQQRQTQSFIASDEQKTKGRQLDIESQRRQDEAKFHEQEAANAEDRNSIEAAHLGVQPQGPTRAQQLRQEMERGRQQTQMDKPLEVPGPDQNTRPGYEKTAEQSKLEEEKSLSTRLSAQANFNRSIEALNKAKVTGDTEAAKRERTSLNNSIGSWQNLYNQGKKGELDANQRANLKEVLGAHNDPELRQELDTNQIGPKTLAAIQAKTNSDVLKYMAATGDMPDGHLVDPASPMMQQFTQTAVEMQSFLKFVDGISYGGLSAIYKIDSVAKKNEVIRMHAAQAMLSAIQNPSANSTNPGSLPTRSAGQQGGTPTPSAGMNNERTGPIAKPGRATGTDSLSGREQQSYTAAEYAAERERIKRSPRPGQR